MRLSVPALHTVSTSFPFLWKGLLCCLCVFLAPQSYAARASFNEAIEVAGPSVVNIYARKVVATQSRHPFANHPFFQDFFRQHGLTQQRVQKSLGSGVIIAQDGHVVTNLHVIEGAKDIRIITHDGLEYPAAYIGSDPKLDIAILRIETDNYSNFIPAQFTNSDDILVGDVALAIGNPFGVGQSVSLGIISAVGRGNPAISQFSTYIQTDAAINPGNSGGALVDSTGAVIGLNTAIFSQSGANLGIGFAIPANLLQAVIEDILTTGKVNRGWLGATGQNLTSALAKQLGLPHPQGVMINELADNGPAQQGGLQIGDVILEFGGRPVANTGGLNAQILATPNANSRPIPVSVWRDGTSMTLQIQLKTLPQRQSSAQKTLGGNHILTGYTVEELSPALNQELGLEMNATGVVVLQAPARQRTLLAMKKGDVIRQINGKDIQTIKGLEDALTRRPRTWKVAYERASRIYRVIVSTR